MRPRRAYSVAVLGVLAGTSGFAPYAVIVLAGDVGASLGATPRSIASLALAQSLFAALAILALAAAMHRRPRVAGAAVLAALAGAGACAAAALAETTWALMGLLAVNGTGVAGVLALHPPLLADRLEPGLHVRGFAAHRALQAAGAAAAAGLVALLATTGNLTWRGVLLALAATSLAAAFAAGGLRARVPVPDPELSLSFSEVARGVVRTPTVRLLLGAQAALGMVTVPLTLLALLFLEDRWGLGPGSAGVVLAATGVTTAVLLGLLAREGEQRLGRGPEQLLRPAAIALGIVCLAVIGTALAPVFGVAVALLCATFGAVALAQVATTVVLMTLVEPAARVHAAALAGTVSSGVGGLTGLLVAVGMVQDIGAAPALGAASLPLAAAAIALRAAADSAAADLAAMSARLAEEAGVRASRAAGATQPLLAAHGVLVRYGHCRAVDGVDLTIGEGELLALLGTNGAGKSTLLRVLSGLTMPDRGSVRMEGRDITMLDSERRHRLGLGHVAAGAAVFDTLRVRESLSLAAHAAGLRREEAVDAVDWAFESFPQLDQRRGARVAALSGGQRQMLALAQVLLRRPRILLVDELSLGLAPGVVQDLLAVVRGVHAEGTTVVVVEQSVDLALELATRAVFLERGRVRFDGDPAVLHTRDDLLRPVFIARTPVAGVAPVGGGG